MAKKSTHLYPFCSKFNFVWGGRGGVASFSNITGKVPTLLTSIVDATKTIHAPYCQGNVTVFGENAGQQCVAMSLCALIYSKITKISSVDYMTQIMIVGIQLYSSLSLLARQSMLIFDSEDDYRTGCRNVSFC